MTGMGFPGVTEGDCLPPWRDRRTFGEKFSMEARQRKRGPHVAHATSFHARYARTPMACAAFSRMGAMAAMAFLLASCATPVPPEAKGKWVPVNRYAEKPVEIPLNPKHLYQPTPADGTLKSMLDRWANDLGVELVYQHPNDYTLHSLVAEIRTHDPMQAISAVSRAYAEQGVVITLDSKRMLVRRELAAGKDESRSVAQENGKRE